VTTNFPPAEVLTTPENIQRLKGIPFFLFSGGDSQVLDPASTSATVLMLKNAFGDNTDVERIVVDGYGHLDCWMGTRASEDVWPMVRERVDAVCRDEGK